MELDKQRAVFLMLELGCWHDFSGFTVVVCRHCGMPYMGEKRARNPDLTTSDGFFLMWNQAQKKEWWEEFKQFAYMGEMAHYHKEQDGTVSGSNLLAWDVGKIYASINPTKFMDTLYDFGVEINRIDPT